MPQATPRRVAQAIGASQIFDMTPRRLPASIALAGSLAFSPVAGVLAQEVPSKIIGTERDRAGLVQALNERLLSNASATLVLDAWCAERGLAPAGSKIIAERVRGQDKPASAEVRNTLGIGDVEAVNYRRVRLRCGDLVLSEADNWYLPQALTPEMNRTLETTDTSFGRVVAPLNFKRETTESDVLWDGKGTAPGFVLRHRARLLAADGRPFSVLVESYTAAVLGGQ